MYAFAHDFAISICLRTEIDGAKNVRNMQWVYQRN